MPHRESTPHVHTAVPPFLDLDKDQLHRQANELLVQAPAAIEQCIRFIEADTFGVWHGHAGHHGPTAQALPASPAATSTAYSGDPPAVRQRAIFSAKDQLRL